MDPAVKPREVVDTDRGEQLPLALILLTWFLGNLSIYFITPGLPELATVFPSSPRTIQLVISFFLLGKAISMLLWCNLSERMGRKPVFIFGLFLYSLSNFLAAASFNIHVLLISRLLQGFAVGATLLMGRCMINDKQNEQAATRQFAWLFTLAGVIICFLPWVGAIINAQFGWRASFFIAGTYSLFLLAFGSFRETKSSKNTPLPLSKSFSLVFKNPIFVGYLTISALMMAGESAFNTSAPFILIKNANFTLVAYGKIKTLLALMHLLGTAGCGLFIRYFISASLVGIGVFLFALAAGLMLFFSLVTHDIYLSLVFPMMIYYFGTGFIVASAAAAAVRPFPKQMATAMGLSLFFQFNFSAVFSLISSLIAIQTVTPFVAIIALIGFLSLVSWKVLIARRTGIAAITT
uniref:MFS transporter n=1 Tax=Legionella lansingensis TaxID=45067 RepID=UPI0006886006